MLDLWPRACLKLHSNLLDQDIVGEIYHQMLVKAHVIGVDHSIDLRSMLDSVVYDVENYSFEFRPWLKLYLYAINNIDGGTKELNHMRWQRPGRLSKKLCVSYFLHLSNVLFIIFSLNFSHDDGVKLFVESLTEAFDEILFSHSYLPLGPSVVNVCIALR